MCQLTCLQYLIGLVARQISMEPAYVFLVVGHVYNYGTLKKSEKKVFVQLS